MIDAMDDCRTARLTTHPLLHVAWRLALVAVLALPAACSFDKMLVRASMPMIDGGVDAMNRESDLKLAEESIPANLNMLLGMIRIDPDNPRLRRYAAQAFYGMAYGFNEDHDPERASQFYRRGLEHGLKALALLGAKDLDSRPAGEVESAVAGLGEEAVPALFWSASNWAKWIDLHRDSTGALAQLPRATALMQRVLELDENYYHGGAHMFFGVYYGSRAPMLGGNFALAEQHFDKARAINHGKLLIVDLLQAQYLDRQKQDRAAFHRRLQGIVDAPDDLLPEMALQNAIAKRKAALLLKKENDWFLE